jgi:hypothetical protein
VLLRSIAKHIEEQNWLAVAIDFVIVVIGVFVGLQAAEWSERNKENELEVAYLERLKEEVQRSYMHNENVSNRMMLEGAEKVDLVIRSLENCELAEAHVDLFAQGLYKLGQFETAYLDTNAIEELKSTGRWGIIDNREIQDTIEQVSRHIDFQARVQPQFVMMIGPPINYVRQYVRFRVDGPDESIPELITADRSFYDFEQLCQDPRFLASLSSIQTTIYQIVEWNQRISALMKNSIAEIEAELRTKSED